MASNRPTQADVICASDTAIHAGACVIGQSATLFRAKLARAETPIEFPANVIFAQRVPTGGYRATAKGKPCDDVRAPAKSISVLPAADGGALYRSPKSCSNWP